jgi:hypothetical protein
MFCRIKKGNKMKKILFVGLMGLTVVLSSFSVRTAEQERSTFCDECGTPLFIDSLSLSKLQKEGKRLLCKKCSKKTKGKKDRVSSSPTSSSVFSLGSDSVFDSSREGSPVSLLERGEVRRSTSAPITFLVDEAQAAQVAEFIVEEKLKKKAAQAAEFRAEEKQGKWAVEEDSFVEAYGEPTTFNVAMSLKIRALETLCEASKKPEGLSYKCTLHHVRKYAEVVDPQGNEQTLVVDGDSPFLFKRGGVMVFSGSGALHIKDLEKGCSSSFPRDTLSPAFVKQKCEEYGFEKVKPLDSYQEADIAFQRRLAQLPSPTFKN